MILSEIVILVSVIVISSQSSSLVSSLILVPSSVLLMMMLNVNLIVSGFMTFVFIMVFIGGLMVLLVSVASAVSQEQWIAPSIWLILASISLISMFFLFVQVDWSGGSTVQDSLLSMISLIDLSKYSVVLSMLLILLVCLFVLTKLMLEFKGLTRSI